ncbi:MAG: outer membrane beta-barrel domain-containing protein [Bdellovibrionaceae bacterium]|nr:outer membrane beta-barrel domain-containing protein [Pseudobdellovibrionaceae bacterium]
MRTHQDIITLFLTLIASLTLWSFSAQADTKKDEKINSNEGKKEVRKPETKGQTTESEKLDVQKLEQKYWSAKDDDFSVVQNRAFPKEKRWYLNLSYGMPLNDPFSAGVIIGTNLGYYWSERWGMEFNYRKASFHDNETTATFVAEKSVYPDVNRFQAQKVLNVTWVPLYAKMSWLDRKIIYFDMGLQLGVGQTEYQIVRDGGNEKNTGMTTTLNLMQHFFFTERLALRIDFTNTWTTESRARYYTSPSLGDRTLPSRTINDSSLMIGLTIWK